MTVREMLNSLSDLPLDAELYIEIDSGEYTQAFSIDSHEEPYGSEIVFHSQTLNDSLQNDFILKEEF